MATIILETFMDSTDGRSAKEVAESLASTLQGAIKYGVSCEVTKRETQLGSISDSLESIDLLVKIEDATAEMLRKTFRRSHFCLSFVINGKRYQTARSIIEMWSLRKLSK